MHKRIYQQFEQICAARQAGGAVLEVGAMPSVRGLLNLPCLKGAREKIGINLNPPARYADFEVVQGNANDMAVFPDGRFDTVLCNAMLEHDLYFWKTVAEIHRVTRRGGLIVIGVPGFVTLPINRWFRGNPPELRLFDWLYESTLTYKVHNTPGDYYRFSLQAMEQVLLRGLKDIQVRSLMLPPRIIGSGIKP